MLLVAYASKSGVAKEAAETLAELLPSANLIDLAHETPILDSYDAVIVGAGVRVWAINKSAKAFLENNVDILGTKKLGIFISHCFAEDAEEILSESIPEKLRACVLWIGSVGGRLDMANLKGLDKVIAKAATRAVKEGRKVHEDLDHAALEELAECFR